MLALMMKMKSYPLGAMRLLNSGIHSCCDNIFKTCASPCQTKSQHRKAIGFRFYPSQETIGNT